MLTMSTDVLFSPDLDTDHDTVDLVYNRTSELDEAKIRQVADLLRYIGDDVLERYSEPRVENDAHVRAVVKESVKDVIILLIRGISFLYKYRDCLP